MVVDAVLVSVAAVQQLQCTPPPLLMAQLLLLLLLPPPPPLSPEAGAESALEYVRKDWIVLRRAQQRYHLATALRDRLGGCCEGEGGGDGGGLGWG